MGKHKYIETPEKMWELFLAYVTEVKTNPRIKVEYVGRNGDRVETPLETPLTYDGFQCFGYDNDLTVHHYFDNPEGAYDNYREVCSRIKKQIRADQISGGMVGQYNASITQRLNGLTDKQAIQVTETPPLFPDDTE